MANKESALERGRKVLDLASIGLMAVGLFFSPTLTLVGALHYAESQTIGKEVVEKLEKLKNKLTGKDNN